MSDSSYITKLRESQTLVASRFVPRVINTIPNNSVSLPNGFSIIATSENSVNVNINGNLNVSGGIDPIFLQLKPQTNQTIPFTENGTLWVQTYNDNINRFTLKLDNHIIYDTTNIHLVENINQLLFQTIKSVSICTNYISPCSPNLSTIIVNANLVPFDNTNFSLGTIENRWSTLWTNNIYINNLFIGNSVIGKEQGKDDLVVNDVASINNVNAPVQINPNGSTVIGGTAPYPLAPAKNTLWGSTDIRTGADESVTVRSGGSLSLVSFDNAVEIGADTGVSIQPGAGAVNITLSQVSNTSGVSITETGGSPNFESAVLDVSSNDRGLYIPRLTSTQRSAIANPQNGLLCYDTTIGSLAMYGPRGWAKVTLSGIDVLGAEPSYVDELHTKIAQLESQVLHMDSFLKAIDEALYIEGWPGYTSIAVVTP